MKPLRLLFAGQDSREGNKNSVVLASLPVLDKNRQLSNDNDYGYIYPSAK